MLLTDKYADLIYGTITCYDRMIIQGYIPGWSHVEGMASYLKANSIRIFDFQSFLQPFTGQVRQNAQQTADENGIEIESIHLARANVSITTFISLIKNLACAICVSLSGRRPVCNST